MIHRHMVYDPSAELHLMPASEMAQKLMAESLQLYTSFSKRYRQALNLDHPGAILDVYNAAQQEGIFATAEKMRQAFFGMDMHFYGVTYLWDICIESCIYCPAALSNRIKTKYKPLSMTVDTAVKDVKYVMQDGHRHLCVLTGEEPRSFPATKLAEYLSAFDELGLREIILNVEPPIAWTDFKIWRDAVKHTALQFRVFQETYNKEKYQQIHPKTKFGRKHDFERRYESQIRAIEYGFDNVGIGVLFGNHHLPMDEIDALQQHANLIQAQTGKFPARVCMPSAKYLTTIAVEIPYALDSESNLYWKFSELMYALARLALPTANIVTSERDEADLLRKLDKYATCTTLNVHPGVADNIRHHEKLALEQIHFEQAPSYSRDPELAKKDWLERGYNPLLN